MVHPSRWTQVLALLSLGSSLMCATSRAQIPFSAPKNVSNNADFSLTPQVAVDGGGNIYAVWVDARPDEEFGRDHVPGAFSLNEDRWNELLPQFLPNWSPGKKVVVYCSAESCNAARDVAKRLREEAQLKEVFVLQGGWEEWLKKK